jgi:hypothetical protein
MNVLQTGPIAARIRRLQATLLVLRQRVREAVATELGSAVGDAVKDVLSVLVRGRLAPVPSARPPVRKRWDDDPDPDPWDDEDEDEPSAYRGARNPVPEPELPTPSATGSSSARLPQAVAVGFAAANWLIVRKAPAWAGLGIGVIAGVVAWCGGPLLAAGLAAADLIALSHPSAVGG